MQTASLNAPQPRMPKETRLGKWYFGGLASAAAACITHPLDLLKVHLQTQKGKNISLIKVTKSVVKNEGIMGLYNGISASLLRQLTYSTARFGIYESAKQALAPKDGSPLPFHTSALIAGLGGMAGGFIGNPADLVNVRMQNDMKLPPEKRRNYKNAIHGIYKVASKEGVSRLWAGGIMNCTRSTLMTIGQVSFYDQAKQLLLSTPYFQDNVATHVASSLMAVSFYDQAKQLLLSTPYFQDNVATHVASSLMAVSFYDQAKQLLLSTPYFQDNVATHVASSLMAVSRQFSFLACRGCGRAAS
ncbi:mitochondrial carrier protein domain-containing protein [Phthorimaea operculella]|nr:mitochondrial carrier protein domain-containing protein [Phthorimaea operculella]